MHKKIIYMGTIFLVTHLVAVQEVRISHWQKAKTILTSTSAQIIYGIMGITLGVGATYFVIQGRKEAQRFELIFNPRKINEFSTLYDLQEASFSYKVHTESNTIIGICFYAGEYLSAENRTLLEKKLWHMVRCGQHASWFMGSIKVMPIIEDDQLKVNIDFVGKNKSLLR